MQTHRERTELSPRGPYAWAIKIDGEQIGILTSQSVWKQEWHVYDNFNRTHEMLDFPPGEAGRMDMAVQFAIFMDMEMR